MTEIQKLAEEITSVLRKHEVPIKTGSDGDYESYKGILDEDYGSISEDIVNLYSQECVPGKFVIWKDGSYKHVPDGIAFEFEADKNWLVTIPLTGYNAGREWQDISTAPEGYHHPYAATEHWTTQPKATYVPFANEHHAGVGFVQIEDDNDENDNPIIVRRYCDEHGDYIDTPLGWMPLPTIPSPPVI